MEAQRTLLLEMGCERIQGWLMSKALPADELARCFASQALRMHSEAQENGMGLIRSVVTSIMRLTEEGV
jgi:hypothetical protein